MANPQELVPASLSVATAAPAKLLRMAYLLWAVLGLFGAHRLYLGFTLSGAGMAAISLVSVPLIWSGLGLLGFVVTGTWMLADGLLLPGMVRSANGD